MLAEQIVNHAVDVLMKLSADPFITADVRLRAAASLLKFGFSEIVRAEEQEVRDRENEGEDLDWK